MATPFLNLIFTYFPIMNNAGGKKNSLTSLYCFDLSIYLLKNDRGFILYVLYITESFKSFSFSNILLSTILIKSFKY